MRSITIFFVAACLAVISTVIVAAQSGRDIPFAGSKANQRPPPSSPTPLPTPQPDTPTITAGDDTAVTTDDGEVIKVDTQLVSIPVRVMDKKGRFIGGLVKENFKVFEGGVEQQVALFSNEHQPFTVALVLDMSYSTTFKIGEIQSAAIAFIDQLRPQDKVMVISFDEDVHMLCEVTDDRNAVYRAIKRTKIATGTSIYEALDMVMNDRLRRIDGRKAIILFTDGVDTTSRRSNDLRNLSDAMELDSLVYPIRYDTFADVQRMKRGGTAVPGSPSQTAGPTIGGMPIPLPVPVVSVPSSQGTTPEEYQKAEEYLNQLALRTGGRIYQASTFGNLGEAYSRIASELREFYSIGYYPEQLRSSGKHANIKVKVDQPGVVVRARDQYVFRKKKAGDR
ncbi:MAG: VWA domain-containing protein [Pyrinomonadaceae bacterium]